MPALAVTDYPKTFDIDLHNQRLVALANGERFGRLSSMESYYKCTQYDHRAYDWDGSMRGSSDWAMQPGYVVPLRQRKPNVRGEMARQIVKRLTTMVFGQDRFPTIQIPGDPEAEDFINALATQARLPARMREARNLGGAQGSVCMSFGFVNGKPRIRVQNAKTMFAVRWADKDELELGSVLQCYADQKTIRDKEGNPKVKTFYYCRYWDENVEIVWDPIPEEVARTVNWVNFKHQTAVHDFGFCPVYWIQNHPSCDSVDGESDYEGLCDAIDGANQVISQGVRGVTANGDPTLVIKDDRGANTGVVRKGLGQAIYSKGGAELLELSGDSLRASLDMFREIKGLVMDTAQVVLADPEQIAAKAQSAAAMRMFYAPMLAVCDELREQYGDFGIIPLMEGMLKAAKKILGREPGPEVRTIDGRLIQHQPTVVVPPRVVRVGDDDELVERSPGQQETVTLLWPAYFAATPQDLERKINAVTKANGEKPVISERTAVQYMAKDFGIDDIEEEVAALETDRQKSIEEMGAAAEIMAPKDEGTPPRAGGEDEGGAGTAGGGESD